MFLRFHPIMKLSNGFFERNTRTVAKDLLGKILVNGETAGRIVETEAYFGEKDPASHASMKSKKRSAIMFGPPGCAYVYFTYGNHWMFNVVTEKEGKAGAVLIRALQPVTGIPLMKKRRATQNIFLLTNGPARLTQALGINKKFNGKTLSEGELFILNYHEPKQKIKISSAPRIGISKGKEALLRFFIKGNRFVSK